MKPITEAARAYEANAFVEHVKKMHIERDRGFEEEFKVNEAMHNYIIHLKIIYISTYKPIINSKLLIESRCV